MPIVLSSISKIKALFSYRESKYIYDLAST